MTKPFLLAFLFASSFSTAQDFEKADSSQSKKPLEIILGAYADTYYAYYLNGEPNKLQVHNSVASYNQTFGLNVAQLSAEVNQDRFRGKMTLQFGDIPNIAWTGLRAVQEAYSGLRIGKRTWFDLGFFKTHVGAESFLPKDNLMSQISLATYYGPFYQSGARVIHESKSGWHLEGHLISGYNRQIDDNNTPSVGVLVSKELKPNVLISYSNLFGEEERAQNNADFLFYNNIYTNFSFGKWQAQVSADLATQLGSFEFGKPSESNILIASLATFKRQIKDGPHSIAFKGEWFYDPSSINSINFSPDRIIVGSGINLRFESIAVVEPFGLNVIGATIGYEYAKENLGFLRIESRYLRNFNGTPGLPNNYERGNLPFDGFLADRLGAFVTLGIYFDKKMTFAQ